MTIFSLLVFNGCVHSNCSQLTRSYSKVGFTIVWMNGWVYIKVFLGNVPTSKYATNLQKNIADISGKSVQIPMHKNNLKYLNHETKIQAYDTSN